MVLIPYNKDTKFISNYSDSLQRSQYIETGLGNLNLKSNPENRKKYFKKTLKEFKEYLKEKYSLVSAGHYTGLYISLGASFGIVVGIIIGERTDKSLGIALGISIGMLIPNYALVKTRTCNIFIMNKLYELC